MNLHKFYLKKLVFSKFILNISIYKKFYKKISLKYSKHIFKFKNKNYLTG